MEKQDETRRKLFDYLQRELSKEKIDIQAKEIAHHRSVQFFYNKRRIGIYRISNFYKQGIKFEVSYYFDDYVSSIQSFDTEPIILYLMPEEVVIKAEKRNAKFLKQLKEMPIVFMFMKPQNPREKYIISQEEFEKECLKAIRNKRDKYIEWLRYQMAICADLLLPSLKTGVSEGAN